MRVLAMNLLSFRVLSAVSYVLTVVTDTTLCLHDALPKGLDPGSLGYLQWQPSNDQHREAQAPSIVPSKHTANTDFPLLNTYKSVSNIGTLVISFITFELGVILKVKYARAEIFNSLLNSHKEATIKNLISTC